MRSFCVIVTVILLGLSTPGFSQESLKVNGELEVNGDDDLNKAIVKVLRNGSVIETPKTSKKGFFSFSVDLQSTYELTIEFENYIKERIPIYTIIDTSILPSKLWPVFLKVKLSNSISENNKKWQSQISYNADAKRFEHKITDSPYKVSQGLFSKTVTTTIDSSLLPTSSGVNINNSGNNITPSKTSNSDDLTFNSAAKTDQQLLDEEEKKVQKNINDKQLKSRSTKDLVETYQKSKLNGTANVKKLQVLSEEIIKRLDLKHADVNNLNEYLMQYFVDKEYESRNRLQMALQKRRLIEEIVETKKEIKIDEDNFNFEK